MTGVQYSPDGRWWWDGAAWQPVPTPPPPPPGYAPPGYAGPGYAPPGPVYPAYAQVAYGQPITHAAAAGPAPGLRYAGFWYRFLAYLIDAIPIVVVLGILGLGVTGSSTDVIDANGNHIHQVSFNATGFVPLLVITAYFIVCWALFGATVGQRVLGIRIVRAEDGQRPTPAQALIRGAGFIVSSAVLALGLIWAGWDKRKQGWHDKMAKTFAVRSV